MAANKVPVEKLTWARYQTSRRTAQGWGSLSFALSSRNPILISSVPLSAQTEYRVVAQVGQNSRWRIVLRCSFKALLIALIWHRICLSIATAMFGRRDGDKSNREW